MTGLKRIMVLTALTELGPIKLTVPPATPGPLPSLSAYSVTVPVSDERTPLTVTSLLARIIIEPPPSAVAVTTLTSRNACKSICALLALVVNAALTKISLPAVIVIFELIALAVIAAVTLTSLPAFSTIAEPSVLAVMAALMRTS